jgi:mannonate dehydratase
MTYDPDAPAGTVPPTSPEQLWSRFETFLREVVPVAEEAGVRMALHPDDPPMPTLRGHARLVHKPEHYQRVLDLYPSRSNALEFCQGTIAEMRGEMDVYEAIDRYSRQGAIAYVHFRNVQGKVPRYHEVFLDEGDVDMIEAIRIYYRNGYDGVMIPDHTPHMTCAASWHAGMAYALGYMRAAIQLVEAGA